MARDVAFEGLLSAADRFCATRANTGCAAAGLFAEIVGNARAAPANPEPPQPRQLPACRHLATALSLGQSGSAADLAAHAEINATIKTLAADLKRGVADRWSKNDDWSYMMTYSRINNLSMAPHARIAAVVGVGDK